jgi:ribosomal protein L40E
VVNDECKTLLSLTIKHSPLKYMFCQKCGTENPENGKFCRACGTDLGNNLGVAASRSFQPQGLNLPTADFYIDRRGRVRSNNPDDLWSAGIRNIILGIGFFTVAIALLLTGVANGHSWWWAMLFPAFSLTASGIGIVSKAKRLEKKKFQTVETQSQPTFFALPQDNNNLPPAHTDYVKPQKSIYDTGELIAPPSVTEWTTRHLEINNEGETMTLPDDGKWKTESRK